MKQAQREGKAGWLTATRLMNCYTIVYQGNVRAIGKRFAMFAVALGVLTGAAAIPASAIASGDLMWYRDLNNNGTAGWAFNGQGQRIGVGWQDFTKVFAGANGTIYAIKPNGDLMWYRDLNNNGTAGWAFNGQGQRIGVGWQDFTKVFAGANRTIYAITG